MKRTIFNLLTVSILVVTGTTSCNDWLDVPPRGAFLTENFYSNRDQVFSALVGVYDLLRKNTGGFENMVALANSASDDHVAGGGSASDGLQLQAMDDFTVNPDNVAGSYWNDHYSGIFRANTLLARMGQAPMEDAERQRFTAEARALRALYYFNLVRLFRNVPLITEPLVAANMNQVEQADPAAVYAQIETDLLAAIPSLPLTVPASEYGRLNRGAAQALLGKVYLYRGNNTAAAEQLAIVNGTPGGANPYGYRLLSNFSDLWVFTNKNNAEGILMCTHSNRSLNDWGFWGSGRDEGNTLNVMVGVRGYRRLSGTAAPAALPGGWSFNTYTQAFYDFIRTDPRFSATVLDLAAFRAAGQVAFTPGFRDLGFYLNKFMPRMADVSTLGGAQDLNFQQDSYIIRLADTYLMEAEALGGSGARAQALLDAVRARVGLPSVPVSLAAIKTERRAELAGEGHRFFDLVRWGDAASVLAANGFVAGKNEILPIPFRELLGTRMKQNPNY